MGSLRVLEGESCSGVSGESWRAMRRRSCALTRPLTCGSAISTMYAKSESSRMRAPHTQKDHIAGVGGRPSLDRTRRQTATRPITPFPVCNAGVAESPSRLPSAYSEFCADAEQTAFRHVEPTVSAKAEWRET